MDVFVDRLLALAEVVHAVAHEQAERRVPEVAELRPVGEAQERGKSGFPQILPLLRVRRRRAGAGALAQAALLVFLAAAAGTGVVPADLHGFSLVVLTSW